ncbi:MAG TPA: LysE family transporter [Puia sp.]|nr:LysE family transporter [Puia sp.]
MQGLSGLFLGLILSFLGQLPLGTLSMTATQIAVQENFDKAWKYSVGVALVEMVYLRFVLSGLQWMMEHRWVFIIFNWITVIFFFVLGVLSFITARKQDKTRKALLLNNNLDRFLLGLSMSAMNPAQIPFWMIWSDYFLNLGWLKPGFTSFNFFMLGTGFGTIAGLSVYMYGGNWLVTKMKTSNQTLNKIMGIIFILAAMIQIFRLLHT